MKQQHREYFRSLFLLLVGCVFIAGGVYAYTNPIDDTNNYIAVSEVDIDNGEIRYEELSEPSQKDFRKAIAEYEKEVKKGYDNPSGILYQVRKIPPYADDLQQASTIKLDGTVYNVTTKSEMGLYKASWLFISLLVVLLGLYLFTVSIVRLYGGLVAVLCLSYKDFSYEALEQFSEDIYELNLSKGTAKVFFVILCFSILIVSSIPFLVNMHTVSYTVTETEPADAEITQFENLPEETQQQFIASVGGENPIVYTTDIASEYEYINSDGEYYKFTTQYPIAIESLFVGVLLVILVAILIGLTTLNRIDVVLSRIDHPQKK